ncbi:MAG: DUF4397 domain-containing protein [Chitinophagaceae bacterium]|nr:DUF4397 domain-containing protein [Chitinophagaceae bacterium]
MNSLYNHLLFTKSCSIAYTTAVMFCLSACTKDPGIEETGVQLRFVNASPDAGNVQFNLNGQKAYTPALAYNDTTTYLAFTGGTYNLTSEVGSKTVVNTVVDFIPKNHYTLVMIDSAKKTRLAVFKDDIDVTLAPLRINLRFLNLIPNAPALALIGITSNDTIALSPGKNFVSGSTTNDALFETLPSDVYELLVVSSNAIIARMPARTFVNGKFFTVFARGFIKGVANKAPSIGILQHN